MAKPFATTNDIAESLGVTAQAVRNHSEELAESDLLENGKVDRQTVYWVCEDSLDIENIEELAKIAEVIKRYS
jgi:predicted transcriptional regulator